MGFGGLSTEMGYFGGQVETAVVGETVVVVVVLVVVVSVAVTVAGRGV